MTAKSFKNQQKIKYEQINFLLVDLEQSLDQYKVSIKNKGKQLTEAKRIMVSAKQSFDKISQENRELKAYIARINKQFQQLQQHQQLSSTLSKPKKIIIIIKRLYSKKKVKTKARSSLNKSWTLKTRQ